MPRCLRSDPPQLTSICAAQLPRVAHIDLRCAVLTLFCPALAQATRDSGFLKGFFNAFGRVRDVHLQKDKITFASKNFAFITFARSSEADRSAQGPLASAVFGLLLGSRLRAVNLLTATRFYTLAQLFLRF